MLKYIYILKKSKSSFLIGITNESNTSFSISSFNVSTKQNILTSFKILSRSLDLDRDCYYVIGYSKNITKHDIVYSYLYLLKKLANIKLSRVDPTMALNQVNRYHQYIHRRVNLSDTTAIYNKFLSLKTIKWLNFNLDLKLENMSNANKINSKLLALCVYYLYRKESIIKKAKKL